MFNGKKITSSPQQPWQDAAARDRAGEGNSLARSRSFPSHSLPPHRPAARPPAAPNALHPFAAPLPASNPFASRLPASNPFVSRLRASRPLSGPRDGSSSSSSSSSDLFFDANDEFPTESASYETSGSSSTETNASDRQERHGDSSAFTSDEDVSDQMKANREYRDRIRAEYPNFHFPA